MSNSMATTYWLLLQTKLNMVRLLCPLHLSARGTWMFEVVVPSLLMGSLMSLNGLACTGERPSVIYNQLALSIGDEWRLRGLLRTNSSLALWREYRFRQMSILCLKSHKLFFCRLSGRLCDGFFQKLLLVLSLVASQ